MPSRDYDQRVLVVNDDSADERVLLVNGDVINSNTPAEGDLLVFEGGKWVTHPVAAAGAQPLDSDLTAIAALSTTAYGRAFLELANAAAGRTALGLGTAATSAATAFDTAGAAAAAQSASQPLDGDLTAIAALSTTAYGRSLLEAANAAAAQTLLGLGTLATKSTVASGDITDGTITDTDVAAANKDGTAGTASMRTLGTGATQAAGGTDARLSDTRTPTDASVTVAKLATATVDALTPWKHDLDVFMTPITQTNFYSRTAVAALFFSGYLSNLSPFQNAEIGWDVVLGAGTWTIEVMGYIGTDRGRYTAYLDGVSQGTLDFYDSGALTPNNTKTLAGITVAATGKKRLLLKVVDKNASSSNYFAAMQHVQLRRTA